MNQINLYMLEAYLKIKMEIFMHFTQDTIENF